jgi:micrococcal nuclease
MIRAQHRYWHEPRALAMWLACLAIIIWRIIATGDEPGAPERLDEGVHRVRRVVDGDTLLLESGARVRLQGIDAPESVRPNSPVQPWGPEASAFAKDFVADAGQRVRLTFSLERKDRHDRFLAFVWNGDVMLNEQLVRAGLAHARLTIATAFP